MRLPLALALSLAAAAHADTAPPTPGAGCPDERLVKVLPDRLVTVETLYFETGKAVIKPVSFPTLAAVAAALACRPAIALVEIQGHTDERGAEQYGLKMSDARAQAVRRWLIEHGVDGARLTAVGYGETMPLCIEH